jgi:hypothetical protein
MMTIMDCMHILQFMRLKFLDEDDKFSSNEIVIHPMSIQV